MLTFTGGNDAIEDRRKWSCRNQTDRSLANIGIPCVPPLDHTNWFSPAFWQGAEPSQNHRLAGRQCSSMYRHPPSLGDHQDSCAESHRGLKLKPTSPRITGKLAKQTSLGTINLHDLPPKPAILGAVSFLFRHSNLPWQTEFHVLGSKLIH